MTARLRYCCLLTLCIAIFCLTGCAPKQKYPFLRDLYNQMESESGAARREEPPQPGESGPTSTGPEVERVELPSYVPKREMPSVMPLPPPVAKGKIDFDALTLQKKPIMINVEAMPLNDFITFGIAETLKVNVFTDDQVRSMKTPVTLRMTKELPPPQALEAAIEILSRYGLEVEQRGATLFVGRPKPVPPAARPADVAVGRKPPEGMGAVLQIVPLRYIHSGAAIQLVNEYYKVGVGLKELSRETIMLSGPPSAIKEVMSFLDVIDVPFFQGKQIFNLKLTYWQPDDFVRQMTFILTGLGMPVTNSPREPGIFFIPIKFLGSVLFAAPDEASFKLVIDWKKKLDTPQAAGTDEKVFIYRPRFSRATELIESVRRLYIGGVATPVVAGQPGQSGAPPATGISGPIKPGLKLASDDRRNLVVISSSAAVYADLLLLFEEIDKPVRQVLIEVTIAELTLKDDLKYGLEWYINSTMYDGTYQLGTLFGTGTGGPGLIYNFLADSGKFRTLINAFAQKNLINILSSPRIMALDNQDASIQVGTEVPIVTSEQSVQATTVLQPQVLRNIQYRQTGVNLRVRPTINTDGALTLNISQEVSESQKNAYSSIDSPMILVRRMNTTVVGETGKTIILGGLMSETESEGESKIPFFGDIPLLGYLFKTQSTNKTKTELIVMMTPVILASVSEAVELTDVMKKSLKWYWQGEIIE